jgi:hypothetical protein
MDVVDLMRIRYMKGEPLLQAGDSFDFVEGLTAMETVLNEAKAKGLPAPVAIKQPN